MNLIFVFILFLLFAAWTIFLPGYLVLALTGTRRKFPADELILLGFCYGIGMNVPGAILIQSLGLPVLSYLFYGLALNAFLLVVAFIRRRTFFAPRFDSLAAIWDHNPFALAVYALLFIQVFYIGVINLFHGTYVAWGADLWVFGAMIENFKMEPTVTTSNWWAGEAGNSPPFFLNNVYHIFSAYLLRVFDGDTFKYLCHYTSAVFPFLYLLSLKYLYRSVFSQGTWWASGLLLYYVMLYWPGGYHEQMFVHSYNYRALAQFLFFPLSIGLAIRFFDNGKINYLFGYFLIMLAMASIHLGIASMLSLVYGLMTLSLLVSYRNREYFRKVVFIWAALVLALSPLIMADYPFLKTANKSVLFEQVIGGVMAGLMQGSSIIEDVGGGLSRMTYQPIKYTSIIVSLVLLLLIIKVIFKQPAVLFYLCSIATVAILYYVQPLATMAIHFFTPIPLIQLSYFMVPALGLSLFYHGAVSSIINAEWKKTICAMLFPFILLMLTAPDILTANKNKLRKNIDYLDEEFVVAEKLRRSVVDGPLMVWAHPKVAMHLQALAHAKTVSLDGWVNTVGMPIEEAVKRIEVTQDFFCPDMTLRRRMELMHSYHVNAVLLYKKMMPMMEDVLDKHPAVFRKSYDGDDYVLYLINKNAVIPDKPDTQQVVKPAGQIKLFREAGLDGFVEIYRKDEHKLLEKVYVKGTAQPGYCDFMFDLASDKEIKALAIGFPVQHNYFVKEIIVYAFDDDFNFKKIAVSQLLGKLMRDTYIWKITLPQSEKKVMIRAVGDFYFSTYLNRVYVKVN